MSGLTRMAKMCRECPFKDKCKNKRLEKEAYLTPFTSPIIEDMALMRSMFNLIENKITGNNIEGLKKTREELVNAMTDKKPKEL